VTDWSTIASLLTAGGTLVLAVATFASIRSANRSARISEQSARTAERSLLRGQRPLLVNSRLQDPEQKTQYREGIWLRVGGGSAALELTNEVVYMALSIRNVGTGLAVMHGWHVGVGLQSERAHPPLEDFTAQQLDIYVAPGDDGLWLGALRDPRAGIFQAVTDAVKTGEPLAFYLLYGDFEGGQRVITQFAVRKAGERDESGDRWLAQAARHFNVDRPDPPRPDPPPPPDPPRSDNARSDPRRSDAARSGSPRPGSPRPGPPGSDPG
jgi:hypothetical protein